MLSAFISSIHSYPAMLLAEQLVHQRYVHPGPRKRIALGCGMRVQDVNKLLKNFEESKKMMKRMQGMAKFASKGGFRMPFGH